VASKVGVKTAKSIKSRKARALTKARYPRTATPSPAAQIQRGDPIIEKAKAAVAAMLEEPASAEFHDLHRSQKKLLQRSVDMVCGYVRAKSASNTIPFLYIVRQDSDDQANLVDVYLVNGNHAAERVHGELCK
jgi:hypothetical protein